MHPGSRVNLTHRGLQSEQAGNHTVLLARCGDKLVCSQNDGGPLGGLNRDDLIKRTFLLSHHDKGGLQGDGGSEETG